MTAALLVALLPILATALVLLWILARYLTCLLFGHDWEWRKDSMFVPVEAVCALCEKRVPLDAALAARWRR
jgi:hypothetical protein